MGIFQLLMILMLVLPGISTADDADLRKQLEILSKRKWQAETQLQTAQAGQSSSAQQPQQSEGMPVRGIELSEVEKSSRKPETSQVVPMVQVTMHKRVPVRGELLKMIKDAIMEELRTLSIHGGLLGYYQGRNGPAIGDGSYSRTDGAGFAADLELEFQPFKNGELFMRVHAGEGEGADRYLVDNGALFANLNTIADNNSGNDGLSLLEAFYTQAFFDCRFFVSVGKTEQAVFIDDNAFANDEYVRFTGKAFVNNPMLDSEDEYGPLVAISFAPTEKLNLTVLYESTSRPRLEEHDQKSAWDNILDHPFIGGQITYSPEWYGLTGNYRLYGWGATYDHPKISSNGTDAGWGIGLSFDQKVHDKVGLFARFAYSNDKVYEAPWFWSAGTSLRGIIPSRDEDEFGIGIAGLKANDDLAHKGTEYHLEAYYRIALSEHFAIAPDIQYVIDPLGDSANDNVVAGMIKGQFTF